MSFVSKPGDSLTFARGERIRSNSINRELYPSLLHQQYLTADNFFIPQASEWVRVGDKNIR